MKLISNFLVTTLGALPLPLRRWLGFIFGLLVGQLPWRETRIAALQLELFLGKDCGSYASRIFANLGMSLFEALNLSPFLRQRDYWIECPNVDLIAKNRSSGKGLVLLSAHTGNWDLLAAYGISLGLKLGVVGRETRNKILHHILTRLRAAYGAETLWREGGEIRRIISKLNSGEAVGALIDQDTNVGGMFVPFFGKPVATPRTLVDIAKRLEVDIISAFIFRTASGKFIVELQPFEHDLSTEQILTQFNQRLEFHIRQYPAQWVWFHKRWRSLPDRERLGTRAYLEYLSRTIQEQHGRTIEGTK